MNNSFQVGDRVEACRLVSWTIDEHEDNPLVVQQGDRGTICQVTDERVYIDWDKDQFKRIPRSVSLLHSDWDDPPFRVIHE